MTQSATMHFSILSRLIIICVSFISHLAGQTYVASGYTITENRACSGLNDVMHWEISFNEYATKCNDLIGCVSFEYYPSYASNGKSLCQPSTACILSEAEEQTSAGKVYVAERSVQCPRSATSAFSIACFERILCILSIYLVVKYMSKHATIIASLLCVVHVTNATTCSVTLSSHYEWTGPTSALSYGFNGEWTATGIQDGETYYVKDADYLYFHSLNVQWYVGSTLGSSTVYRYCIGTDLFTCSWYDW
eukprot:963361_1